MPWLLGANFNMSPARIKESGVLRMMKAELVHTDESIGTCFQAIVATTLDFFIVSSGFASAVKDVTVEIRARTTPHRPVTMMFHSAISAVQTLKFVEPQLLPKKKPFGPSLQPPSWADARELRVFRPQECPTN